MKTIFKLTKLSILVLALITYSCNNDDDTGVDVVEINLQNLEVTIDENPTDGQAIGIVQSDGGETSGFSITVQTPAGALSIDADSGELTVADASMFDFESNASVTATITADNAMNTATVTVNVTNINEVAAQDVEVTIDENPADGQSIGTIAVDGEGTLSFSITSQTPQGALSINESTGELTVADAALFDFETNPVITATVSIDNATNTVTSTVSINLSDQDEISAQDLTIVFDENPTDGQVIGSIQAIGSGTLSFGITSQTPAGAINIDTSTGELTVADPTLFDFETNPVINATIEVDNTISLTTAIATINLNDIDEIVVQNVNLTIDENPSTGTSIGTLPATAGGNLTFSITFQNPTGAFNIDQNTGELSVADETQFDFESNPNMLATISVDNGTYSVSANAFVALNDLNELGEFKHGGVIFWIDPSSNNSAGLVCALDNQTSAPWGCVGISTGATDTAIGTGEANTATVLAAGCATGSAVEYVSNLNLNGYNDWFLPSLDEFNEVSINYQDYIWPTIQANGGSALFSTNWTSTEVNGNNAYVAYLGSSNSTAIGKSVTVFSILPIRSFTDF